jgi:hypothetical protein
MLNPFHSAGDILISKRRTEGQLSSTGHLSAIGRDHHLAFDRNTAHEPGVLGNEANHHPVARRFRLHDDVVKAACGEQTVNGVCNIFLMERFAFLKGQSFCQVARVQNLGR